MVEEIGSPPPAPSVPPASDFVDTGKLSPEDQKTLEQLAELLAAGGTPLGYMIAEQLRDPKEFGAKVAWFLNKVAPIFVGVEENIAENATPILGQIVKTLTAFLKPVAETFGVLSTAYVQTIGSTIGQNEKGQPNVTNIGGALGADYAFDNIVKPIAFIASSNDPTIAGAGAENIQKSLGAIVSIHLMTWVVNVVSNLTGLGTLKFVNSFNEVILAAMNARAMGRVAMRPYLDTFMVRPATNELNFSWPSAQLSESATIKAYMRGALTPKEARDALRTAGYQEHFSAQFLTDTQKYLSDSDVGKLVNLGWWTAAQAITYLQQAGWSEQIAPTILQYARNTEVFSILRDAAERLQAQFEAGNIDIDTFKQTLHDMEFSENQIEALTVRAQVSKPKTKVLSYSQVREMYKNNIVDLSYVQNFLAKEGYSVEDQNNLILLDFTEKKDFDLQRQILAARARLLSEKEHLTAQIDINKSEAALAAAETALAKKEAKLSSSLGG